MPWDRHQGVPCQVQPGGTLLGGTLPRGVPCPVVGYPARGCTLLGGTLLGIPCWGYPGGGYPARGYPALGVPYLGGYPGRTTEVVLKIRRAVCLLHSRRRTFLFRGFFLLLKLRARCSLWRILPFHILTVSLPIQRNFSNLSHDDKLPVTAVFPFVRFLIQCWSETAGVSIQSLVA